MGGEEDDGVESANAYVVRIVVVVVVASVEGDVSIIVAMAMMSGTGGRRGGIFPIGRSVFLRYE
jgi:hypothetical protein